MSKGISIAGRKRFSPFDFYETPVWATKEILDRIDLSKYKTILEPCAGHGAISNLISNCIASDIREDDLVVGGKGKDIFTYPDNFCDVVITNPPYNIAQEVVEHSLKVAKNKVIMLLKLSFLESVSRYEFFKNTPLKTVYVFCKRVNMYPHGVEQKGSGAIAYAWYEWDLEYEGKPTIEWINENTKGLFNNII